MTRIRTSNGTETAYNLVPYTVQGGTVGGTQPTFNGTPLFSASYILVGRMCHFEIQVDMDNITNFGTGQYYMTLPFESKFAYQFREGCLHDISESRQYHVSAHVNAGSDQILLYISDKISSGVQDVSFTSTVPVTLTTADNFHIAGTFITND